MSSRKVISACFGWISRWKNTQSTKHRACINSLAIKHNEKHHNKFKPRAETQRWRHAKKGVNQVWFAVDVATIRRHSLNSSLLTMSAVMRMQNHIPNGLPATVSPLVVIREWGETWREASLRWWEEDGRESAQWITRARKTTRAAHG